MNIGADIQQYLLQVLLTSGFFILQKKFKALTASGAVSAAFLGNVVIICCGFPGLGPLLLFFISSLLLSKFLPAQKNPSDKKSGHARDYLQVLCNGGIYGFGALAWKISGDPQLLLCMAVSMAVATADTWSSEAGTRLSPTAYDLLTFRPLRSGVSGGVSVTGTIAGIMGATLIAFTTSCFLNESPSVFSLILAGTAGMLLDSLLGRLFQIKYKDVRTGQWADAAETYSDVKGLSFVTNDLVNIISNAGTTIIFYFVA